MTSTCLLVLLLTSVAAAERLDDYTTHGPPSQPPDATTPTKNVPYHGLCHPAPFPLWDCDPTLNLYCSTVGSIDGEVKEEVAEGVEGVCSCGLGPKNPETEYHEDLLDFVCPLKTLVDTAAKRDAARTGEHRASCGYDKKDPETDTKIKACKEGLYCNFNRGKVCTCPKEKPIRDTVANVCSGKTPHDAFPCQLKPPAPFTDCAEHTHCDAATRKCVCDDGLGDWLPAPTSRCEKVTVAANGEACGKNEECDSRHCKDKKCAQVQEVAGTQIAVFSAALIIAAVLVALIH